MPLLVPINVPLNIHGNAHASVSGAVPMKASGQLNIQGTATLLPPVAKNLPVRAGRLQIRGSVRIAVGAPFASFKDFALYPSATVDPSVMLIGATNAGATTHDAGSASGMRRFFLSTSIPAGAKYASVGMKFASMPNASKQYLTGVQTEIPTLGASAPAAYSPARSISILVKPTRLNYVRNSNMNHSAATDNWTGDQLTSNVVGSTVTWNGLPSMTVTVPSTAPAAGHPDHRITQALTDLLPGRTYTVSFKVTQELGCAPVWVIVDGNYVMETTDGVVDAANNRWVTIWATFQATATSHTIGLAIRPQDKTAGVTNKFEFTGVLGEEAHGPGVYFDGEDGDDFLYESGVGATKNARSFYYEDRVDRAFLLVQLLAENTPLGVLAGTPIYGTVPTRALANPVTAPQPIIFPRTPYNSPGGITGTNLGNSQLGGVNGTNITSSPLGPFFLHR